MERITPEECARNLLDSIPRWMNSLRGEMRSVPRSSLSVPQFRILNRLSQRGQTNQELAEWMGVAAPTMSRMVETLVGQGLLSRAPDPRDGRKQVLSLTARGQREAERIRAAVRVQLVERIGLFEPWERESLNASIELLNTLFNSNDKHMKSKNLNLFVNI